MPLKKQHLPPVIPRVAYNFPPLETAHLEPKSLKSHVPRPNQTAHLELKSTKNHVTRPPETTHLESIWSSNHPKAEIGVATDGS